MNKNNENKSKELIVKDNIITILEPKKEEKFIISVDPYFPDYIDMAHYDKISDEELEEELNDIGTNSSIEVVLTKRQMIDLRNKLLALTV